MKLTLTVPAHANFGTFAQSPVVEAVRLNTTIALNNPLEEIIKQIADQPGNGLDNIPTEQATLTGHRVQMLKDGELHYLEFSMGENLDNAADLDEEEFHEKAVKPAKKYTLVVPSSVEKRVGMTLPRKGKYALRPGTLVDVRKLSMPEWYVVLNPGEYLSVPAGNGSVPDEQTLEQVLKHAKQEAGTKDVWVDLKCSQLRISDYNVDILQNAEVHYITLSHNIQVNCPTELWIDDGHYVGNIAEVVKGNTLVVPSSVDKEKGLPLPKRGQIGIRPGMSVNIVDPSLTIEGYLTEKDKRYIEAAKNIGIHNYMLSYVERESDITSLLELDPEARIIAKIESKKGLSFVRDVYPKYRDTVTLMAARGDMYVEVDRPDQIIDGCEQIIEADPDAVMASRIFESLKNVEEMPHCQDMFDVYSGMQMGYKHFMMGDDICIREDSVKAAIGLFKVLAEKYERLHEKTKFELKVTKRAKPTPVRENSLSPLAFLDRIFRRRLQ